MTNLMLYFTGTGNSLMVAKSLASGLGDSELLPFTKIDVHLSNQIYERIGLIFPVYYGGPPVKVVESIPALQDQQESYTFAVATHAGGPGQVLSHLNHELQKIGLELSAGFDLGMPNNYLVGYAAPTKEQIESILARADRTLIEIEEIIQNKIAHKPASGFSPFSGMNRGYQEFIGNVKRFDERYLVEENCTECGICERVCPVRNITLEEGKPQWHHQCEMCLACLNWCPERAIQLDVKTADQGRYTNPRVSIEDLEY